MMLLLAALATAQASPPVDCAAFAKQADTPVVISTTPIAPAEIGSSGPLPQAPGSSQTFAVGKLVYSNGGVSIRSTDPRFAQIEIGDSPYPHHRCGYAIDGPTGWNARDQNLSKATLKFQPQSAGTIGPSDAAKRGSVPTLAGYQPGQSARIFGSWGMYFIGLMHRGNRPETVVVAFSARHGPSDARILARIPMRFDGLQILPYIHGPGFDLSLEGRDPDGTLHRANLSLTGTEADRIAVGLAVPLD
jgi:hypothetical protein